MNRIVFPDSDNPESLLLLGQWRRTPMFVRGRIDGQERQRIDSGRFHLHLTVCRQKR